jgi:hypothetical protein
MDVHIEQQKSYQVEVSGWDASERFFVEKTTLDWSHEAQKQICLRSSIAQGCVVFVRLLQSLADGNNFPIAYQATEVAEKDAEGRARVRLAQSRPRPSFRETAEALEDSAIKVA